MKILLVRVSLSLFLLQFWSVSYGQTTTQQLTAEEIANRVAYVHGNEFVLNNPTLVTALGKVMTDRIEYRAVEQDPTEKFPMLSTMPLLSKANPTIQGADFANFNLQAFNPLVYNLDFFSDKASAYRIDNTNYIMVVKPITRN